jgi:hypothetical protein
VSLVTNALWRLAHRFQTASELLGYMAGTRPWMVPVLVGLLGLSGLVMLAQASQVAPFIYTLF